MSHKTTLASVRLGRGEAIRMPLFVNWVGPATPQTPGRDEVLEGLRPSASQMSLPVTPIIDLRLMINAGGRF